MKTTQVSLPRFERFNEVAANDELFGRLLAGEVLDDLPADEVFIVAHTIARDTPYLRRDYHELVYVLQGRVSDRIEGQELLLLPDSLCLVRAGTLHGLVATNPSSAAQPWESPLRTRSILKGDSDIACCRTYGVPLV